MLAEFYKDVEIFMTGGSGVVGKAAIEKLLRSCDVKKIYILLRSRRGVSVNDRLEEMKKSRIFDVLKRSKPNELDKLVAIPGDLLHNELGISQEHKKQLENVSIFVHSAATTRFNEPLRQAIRLNVKSTLEALTLAQSLKRLKIFVHVSTFFSNPHVKYIQDKMYTPVFGWRTALKLLESESDTIDSTLDCIAKKVIGGFPNTYTFTKHLGEQLVNEYRFKLPVAIYRPSIVVNSIEEPEAGFTECATGVLGLVLVMNTGVLKTVLCNENNFLDFTPLDICVKYMLIFTARIAQYPRERFEESIPITSFSSRGIFNGRFGSVEETLTKCTYKNPCEKSLLLPGARLTQCPVIAGIYTILLQLLPAILIDTGLRLAGRKPVMMAIQRKIIVTTQVMNFFLSNEYQSDGPTDYEETLKISEGTVFDISCVRELDGTKERYLRVVGLIADGVRKYLLNESDLSLTRSKRILQAKFLVLNALRVYLIYVVVRAIYRRLMMYMGQ